EHADPDLATALHVARHRATRCFDLTRRHPRAAGRLESELAEGNIAPALSQAGIPALEHLAVLGTFWLQHGCLLSVSGLRRRRSAVRRASRSRDRCASGSGGL